MMQIANKWGWVVLGGSALLATALVFQTLQLNAVSAKLETAETKLTAETSRADRNAVEVERLAAINTANEALAAEVRSIRSTLDKQSNSLIEAIINAPPELDGGVSPVLRDALHGLRKSAGAAD